MSLLRIKESIKKYEDSKPNKLVKVISLKHAASSNAAYSVSGPVHKHNNFSRSTPISDKQGDNASKVPESSMTGPLITGASHMGDSKLPTWHYLMEQAFESFLLRLDDIFLSLRKDVQKDGVARQDVTSYQDICEKLRTEILIAMDRLEFVAMPVTNVTEDKAAFLDKLNGIKRQLSDLRWQYHNAIKDLGGRVI